MAYGGEVSVSMAAIAENTDNRLTSP